VIPLNPMGSYLLLLLWGSYLLLSDIAHSIVVSLVILVVALSLTYGIEE